MSFTQLSATHIDAPRIDTSNINLTSINGSAYPPPFTSVAPSPTTYPLVWPKEQGKAGETLINDGNGNLSWGKTSNAPTWELT